MAKTNTTGAQTPPQNGEPQVKGPEIHEVSTATPFEKVLEWDQSGERITFNTDKGSFREFTAEELAQLSDWFKRTYSVMRRTAESQNPEADEFARHFKVTNPATALGSPMKRVNGVSVARGLKHMYFRPDLLADAYEKGYRPPRPGEVLGGAHQREGHFELPDAVTGGTEQVLLVKDREQDRKDAEEFAKKRVAFGDQREEAAKEAVNRTGYKARNVDSKDDE